MVDPDICRFLKSDCVAVVGFYFADFEIADYDVFGFADVEAVAYQICLLCQRLLLSSGEVQ